MAVITNDLDWLGRFQLGAQVPLLFCATNGSGVPTLPDAVPCVIVSDSVPVSKVAVKVPIISRYEVTALFCYLLELNSTFSAGRYRAEFSYKISGTGYAKLAEFEVLSSGATGGMGTSLVTMSLPNVEHAVMGTSQGVLKRYRNPRPL